MPDDDCPVCVALADRTLESGVMAPVPSAGVNGAGSGAVRTWFTFMPFRDCLMGRGDPLVTVAEPVDADPLESELGEIEGVESAALTCLLSNGTLDHRFVGLAPTGGVAAGVDG